MKVCVEVHLIAGAFDSMVVFGRYSMLSKIAISAGICDFFSQYHPSNRFSWQFWAVIFKRKCMQSCCGSRGQDDRYLGGNFRLIGPDVDCSRM